MTWVLLMLCSVELHQCFVILDDGGKIKMIKNMPELNFLISNTAYWILDINIMCVNIQKLYILFI